MLPITRAIITHPVTRPYLKNPVKYQIREVRAIVAHWTANTSKGATAWANRNYFNNGSPGPGGKLRQASAHYCVDDRMVVQCLPDLEVAYHVGAARYRPEGYELFRDHPGLSPNYFTVGFEMCVNSDGDWDLTRAHSVDLAAHLLCKHGLGIEHLIRHYDITGKDCPKMFLEDMPWAHFKNDVMLVMNAYQAEGATQMRVASDGLNVRSGPGVQFPVRYSLLQNELVVAFSEKKYGEWIVIGEQEWVNSKYLTDV